MITKKTRRNGVTVVSSSYFEDIQMLSDTQRESKQESYIPRWERSKSNQRRNFGEYDLSIAVMKLQLAKKGCAEVGDFESKIPEAKKKDYIFNYGPCKEYMSYEDLQMKRNELEEELAQAKTAEEKVAIQEDIDATVKEIKSIDDFVERNIADIERAKADGTLLEVM